MSRLFTENFGHQLGTTASKIKEVVRYQFGPELKPYSLLEEVDPFLSYRLTKEEFERLRSGIGKHSEAIDYAAGRNPFRSLVFADVERIIAVDPAYGLYHRDKSYQEHSDPRTSAIFGGTGERKDFEQLLRNSLKSVQMPSFGPDAQNFEASGVRFGRKRTISLIPEYVENWLEHTDSVAPMVVVWRAFPSAKTWGKILSRLKLGGILITTGYGKPNSGVIDYPQLACGIDVDNSSLPRNGNVGSVGLTPLIDSTYSLFVENGPLYFYRKVKNLTPEEIERHLIANAY